MGFMVCFFHLFLSEADRWYAEGDTTRFLAAFATTFATTDVDAPPEDAAQQQ